MLPDATPMYFYVTQTYFRFSDTILVIQMLLCCYFVLFDAILDILMYYDAICDIPTLFDRFA